MEACYQAKVSYLDTSVAVDLCSEGQQVPQAYDWQWGYREKFAEAGITGILGAGFDPGVVSVFAAHAVKHLFDEIDTIDVMDVNAGDHGKKFATNFDPETNMLEIQGDSFTGKMKSGNKYLVTLVCLSLISLTVVLIKFTQWRTMKFVQ